MKRARLFISALALTLLLTACGGSATEKKMTADLAEYGILTAEGLTEENITGIKTLKKEHDRDSGQTLYEVNISAALGETRGTVHAFLTYSDGSLLLAQVLPDSELDPVPDERLISDAKQCGDPLLERMTLTGETVDRTCSNADVSVSYAEVTLTGEGPGYTGEICVELGYELTNSGWQPIYFSVLTRTAIPAEEIDGETALALAAEYLGVDAAQLEISDTSESLETGEEFVTLRRSEEYAYLSIRQAYELRFVFLPDTLSWQADGQTGASGCVYDWDIEGRWSASGGHTTVRAFDETDYEYHITADVTDLGDGRYQVDFDLAPGFYNSQYKTGTVYFDTAGTEVSRHGGLYNNGEARGHWNMRSDGSSVCFAMDAEDGLYVWQDGFSAYMLERE